MDMSLKILVAILSSILVIFLVVAIVATVKVIQILRGLKRITLQAEKLADSAEAVGEFVRKSAGPLALGRLVANVVETVRDHTHNTRRKS